MSHSSSGSVANSSTSGQVLGATAPAVLGATAPVVLGGAALLPVTGNNPLVMVLVVTSMAIAGLVIVSFIASRVIRKFI